MRGPNLAPLRAQFLTRSNPCPRVQHVARIWFRKMLRLAGKGYRSISITGLPARRLMVASSSFFAWHLTFSPTFTSIVPVYDRSCLIERAVENLSQATRRVRRGGVVCFIFLSPAFGVGCDHLASTGHSGGLHRHALPGGERQHHLAARHCNCIDAIVDAAVGMENILKHPEHWEHAHTDQTLEVPLGGERQSSSPVNDNYLERLTHAARVRFAVGFYIGLPLKGGSPKCPANASRIFK